MIRRSILAIGLLLLLAACGVPAETPVGPRMADWHTNLSVTSCAEYTDSMTPGDQLVAAKWILAIQRRIEVSDASDGAEFASGFVSEIEAACAKYYTPTTQVLAGAGMAYHDDLSLHPIHH